MKPDRPLKTVVGLLLLVVGLALYGVHLWQHRGVCVSLDGDVKIALGIGAVGLLLLPFDFRNLREVASRRFSGAVKTLDTSGPNGPTSKPSDPG